METKSQFITCSLGGDYTPTLKSFSIHFLKKMSRLDLGRESGRQFLRVCEYHFVFILFNALVNTILLFMPELKNVKKIRYSELKLHLINARVAKQDKCI